MPDIGSTLREARMRARIDISEIETSTKIRAKYLRALENEEWDLLPGPAYVKSFLRTYADALGLDSKLLLEEYKLRHERLSDIELQPIRPATAARRGPQPRALPRGWAIALVVLALIGALYLLGRSAGDNGGSDATTPPPKATPKPAPAEHPPAATSPKKARKKPRLVRLQVVPTGAVYVCLVAKGQGALINGSTLQAGQTSSTFRSSRFRINLGNNLVRLRVNGKLRSVPASSKPIGYQITPNGTTRLPDGKRPTCGQ